MRVARAASASSRFALAASRRASNQAIVASVVVATMQAVYRRVFEVRVDETVLPDFFSETTWIVWTSMAVLRTSPLRNEPISSGFNLRLGD